MELNKIIEEVISNCEKYSLHVTDDIILDVSGRIFNTHLINSYRQGNFTSKVIPRSPATPKQITLMKNLKIKYPVDVSKKEAIKLISEKRGKR